MDEIVIAFEGTTDAIRAEQRLIEAGLRPRAMPLPSRLRAGCGICLRVDIGELARAKECLGALASGWYIRHALPLGSEYETLEVGE